MIIGNLRKTKRQSCSSMRGSRQRGDPRRFTRGNPSDLRLWLDVLKPSTITAPGTVVSQWNDLSRFANNVVPISQPPVFPTSGSATQGIRAVDMNRGTATGNGTAMSSSTGAVAGSHSFFIAFNRASLNSAGQVNLLFNYGADTQQKSSVEFGGNGSSIIWDGSGNVTGSILAGQSYIVSRRYDATPQQIMGNINGRPTATIVPKAFTLVNNSLVLSSFTGQTGDVNISQAWWFGAIVFGRLLNNSETMRVERHMGAKYKVRVCGS